MNNLQKNQYDVVVVGAGASGMMAAITSARNGAKVLLLEHLDKVGKKLLATGNGKCNYTNELQGSQFYRGDNPAFVASVFEQFSKDATVEFFKELGIYPKIKNGYYYPYSEQAASVVEVFQLALRKEKVHLQTECELLQIKNTKYGYKLQTTKGIFDTKSCVFATGLLAGKKCGCDGSAFPYLEQLGHCFIDVVPALVQMKSDNSFLKNLAGIRAEIKLKIYENNAFLAEDMGELLHIEGGISGIVAFQLSRYASKGLKAGKKISVLIDYYPNFNHDELLQVLKERFYTYGDGKNALEAMIGFMNYKLALAFFKQVNLHQDAPATKVSPDVLHRLAQVMKSLELEISGTKDFEDAQVCAGGLDTTQFENDTLESKVSPGIYACGELLDIDGICGGYNLQWAWSSGYVAGRAAALKTVVTNV